MVELGRYELSRSKEVTDKLRKYESPAALSFALSNQSIVQDKGKGMYVTDIDGNTYLDLMSGFGALSTGYSHPKVVESVCDQAGKTVHAMATTAKLRAEVLEKIASLTPGPLDSKFIQLGVGGSDAIETAIKQATQFNGKHGVIAFEGAFHGRGMGSLSLTSYKVYRKGSSKLPSGVAHIPYAYCYRCAYNKSYPGCDLFCASQLERVLSNSFSGLTETGTVIVEPVQGVGGMVVPPIEFLSEIKDICQRQGVVLIVDEVMSGWGRTGKLFACEHSNVLPDILVTAKGIASGYPLSAVISRREILEGWKTATEGGTFGGNLVSCAAALATINVIEEENLLSNAENIGKYFFEELIKLQEQFGFIGEVRHRGLMVALEMVKDRSTKEPLPVAELVDSLIQQGLLPYLGGYHRNVIGFLPPLICTKSNVDEAVSILFDVFKEQLPGYGGS